MRFSRIKITAAAAGLAVAAAAAPGSLSADSLDDATIPAKDVADMLHAVMESDRTVYTRLVVNRLQNEEQVIKASEFFHDDKALPLPAQMFRFGSEMVADKTDKFFYSLLSLWPINKQNAPTTDVEKEGLEAVADDPDEPFYAEEELGGQKYLTAVYADVAVAGACVSCHNAHKDTPRDDFELDDTMGGVVIRIPIDG